jgi:drug/metabolite transporter (DMT)-like permease
MNLKVIFAFLAIYLIWGSTFTAIVYGLESFPPFSLAATRFLLAGFIFALMTKGKGFGGINKSQFSKEIGVGILITSANALVCWVEQYISSGVTALIVGAMPIWFILFNWLAFDKKAPHISAIIALLIGLIGIVAISVDKLHSPDWRMVLVLIASNCLWVIGSLLIRSNPSTLKYHHRATIQMISGAIFLFIISSLLGEKILQISTQAYLSVAYLAIAGTIIAYSAYSYLLRTVSPEMTSTYALVNPLLAMLLGVIWLNEPFTARLAVASALIIFSVTMVLYGRVLFKKLTMRNRDKIFD